MKLAVLVAAMVATVVIVAVVVACGRFRGSLSQRYAIITCGSIGSTARSQWSTYVE